MSFSNLLKFIPLCIAREKRKKLIFGGSKKKMHLRRQTNFSKNLTLSDNRSRLTRVLLQSLP